MMDQGNLLDYLRKYVANSKLLTLDQLSDADKNNLPENWLDILSVDRDKRLTTVLSHWSNFKDEFEQVVEYIEANLVSVDLIHHGWYYLASGSMGLSPVEDFFSWTKKAGEFLMSSKSLRLI
ncbi:MAG: hypothetical protein P8179_21355 [Candidatus Thiodiazotropha sp.]|jgi:hypothetical protein